MGICSQALFTTLLSDLREGVPGFDQDTLPPEASPRYFAAHALANSFLEKLEDEIDADADSRAYEKFIASNEGCRTWSLQKESLLDDVLCGEFRQAVHDILEPYGEPLFHSLYDLLDRGRTGPGSSLGAEGQSFFAKLFSSELTTTREVLYEMYSRWACSDPIWQTAEVIRSNQYGSHSIEEGSALVFVPKKKTCSRSILIEPTLNGFFQLGLESILREALHRTFGIDLAKQPDLNRLLAKEGSILSSPRSFVTIDLSSASDSVSIAMLRRFLPAWFVDVLMLIRTPKFRDSEGELHELHMISSMGNGSTFPLETLIFSCAVAAVYRLDGKTARASGAGTTFSVFGDDIIVHEESCRKLIRLLNLLGFRVNQSKTFVEGPFRESCGEDYYHGINVRPVFARTLRDEGSLYSLINNLMVWSMRSGIVLTRTVRCLVGSVKWLPCPLYENPDAGIRVPFHLAKSGVRWNRHLQCYNYRYMTPKTRKYRVTEDTVLSPPGAKVLMYNPEGLYLSYLRGELRDSTISIRLGREKSYRTKTRASSDWNRLGADMQKCTVSWRQLCVAFDLAFKA